MNATTTKSYSTQAEAVKAARDFIWGEVSISKRPFIHKGSDYCEFVEYGNSGVRLPNIVVSANVNGNLVAIYFDSFGRKEKVEVVR